MYLQIKRDVVCEHAVRIAVFKYFFLLFTLWPYTISLLLKWYRPACNISSYRFQVSGNSKTAKSSSAVLFSHDWKLFVP